MSKRGIARYSWHFGFVPNPTMVLAGPMHPLNGIAAAVPPEHRYLSAGLGRMADKFKLVAEKKCYLSQLTSREQCVRAVGYSGSQIGVHPGQLRTRSLTSLFRRDG